MIEPQTRLPIPPLETVANNDSGDPVMWFFIAVVGVVAVYALMQRRATRWPAMPRRLPIRRYTRSWPCRRSWW